MEFQQADCLHLNAKVLRFFNGGMQAHGKVTGWLPANPNAEDEPALWRVEHDDGDVEDLSREEVCSCLHAPDPD